MAEPQKKPALKKTTLRLDAALWRDARVRALDEDIDFQDVVERALRLYLKTPIGRKKEGSR